MAWNIPEIKKWAKNHKIEVKLDKESKKYRWTIDKMTIQDKLIRSG